MIGDMNRPDRYALTVAQGPPGQRAVLFALAIRANTSCGVAIGGQWVTQATALSAGSVRRHIHDMEAAGIWQVAHEPGGALLVRFPPVTLVHSPAHTCAGCESWGRALVQGTPRTGAGNPAHWCAPKQKENSENSAHDQEHTAHLSMQDVRSIWTLARDTARHA